MHTLRSSSARKPEHLASSSPICKKEPESARSLLIRFVGKDTSVHKSCQRRVHQTTGARRARESRQKTGGPDQRPRKHTRETASWSDTRAAQTSVLNLRSRASFSRCAAVSCARSCCSVSACAAAACFSSPVVRARGVSGHDKRKRGRQTRSSSKGTECSCTSEGHRHGSKAQKVLGSNWRYQQRGMLTGDALICCCNSSTRMRCCCSKMSNCAAVEGEGNGDTVSTTQH